MFKNRMKQVDWFMQHPFDAQQNILNHLTSKGANTIYGKTYNMPLSGRYEAFSKNLPVTNYAGMKPYIDRVMAGEQGVIWPDEITWFAKSSGTATGKSKHLPVTMEALEECHYKAGKDLIGMYCQLYPDTKFFSGKGVVLGGSHQPIPDNERAKLGDVSAVMLDNLPFIARMFRAPSAEIALMDEWEEKLDLMAKTTVNDNITNISGVPTWTLVLIKKLFEITGKNNLSDIWPNLELYMHGGVNFGPYKEEFKRLIDNAGMRYMQGYNASEGFFGIQYQKDVEDMLLMLDYGIFYEFIPTEELQKEHPTVLPLEGVEAGKEYAILISTNSGLWRYKVGDIVRFTGTQPYTIQVSGRTTAFINAFGEEVIMDNADKAILAACKATGARIAEYTAGPIYLTEHDKGGHEWAIEFEQEPNELSQFTQVLDQTLQSVNSDYEAKRYKDLALKLPVVHNLPKGSFYRWLRNKGKLGAQNKVPRLCNDRKLLEEVLGTVLV